MKQTIARFFHFLFFLVLLIGLPLPTPAFAAQKNDRSPDEILIKFKSSVPETEKQNFRGEFKLTIKHKIDRLRLEVLKVPEGAVDDVIAKLKKRGLAEYAEPNFQAEKVAVTNDPLLAQQWGLFKINAANNSLSSAWDITTGNPTVKVAVLDTGIETTHPDLAGKVVTNVNFTTSPTTLDKDGHGTHVAGIIAAATNNGIGIAGTGYNTVLINGKVLGDNGSGYYSWITNGIIWAADQGAQVISMSLSGSSPSQALEDAINYAWNKGAVVVAAAGNNNNTVPGYPAYYTNVIAVAATDSNDNRASFSTYGNWVDVAAPGASIYSTYKNNSYAFLSGTSMATPFTAGTAALIWAKGTCLLNLCVRDQIEKTADQIPGTGTFWIWGRINAYNAVTNNVSLTTPTPTPTPTTTSEPTATPTPTAIPAPIPVMTVSDITLSSAVFVGIYKRIEGVVTVIDENTNTFLGGATVNGTIKTPSGKISSFSASTGTNGKMTVRITSKEKGTFTLNVTKVTKSTYTYHPTVTTKSLIVQ